MGADGLGEGEKKLVETDEFLEIQQFHQFIVYVAAEELGGTVGEPKIHPSTNHREDRCYEGVESLEECIVDFKDSSIPIDECVTKVVVDPPQKKGFLSKMFGKDKQTPELVVVNPGTQGTAKKIAQLY